MASMLAAGVHAWRPMALVIDLTEVAYDWGDEMSDVLTIHAKFPTAVVCSDLNRGALTSLIASEMDDDPTAWLFTSIDEAVAACNGGYLASVRRHRTATTTTARVSWMEDLCPLLWSYLGEAEGDLWFQLRLTLDWDEAAYRRLVRAISEALENTADDELVPRQLAWVFVSVVPAVLGLMSRDDFVTRNLNGRSIDDARAFYRDRERLLRDLCLWFTDGVRPPDLERRLRV